MGNSTGVLEFGLGKKMQKGDFWGLIKFSISGKTEMYPEKISFLHFFSMFIMVS